MDVNPELVRLGSIERDLERAFPDVPATRVKETVDRNWLDFLDAPVREYIPLLVRHRAIDELRGRISGAASPAS